MDLPDVLTVTQVAKSLSVSEEQVRRWIREGALQHTRLGPRTTRITQAQLQAFLENHKADNEQG